MASVGCCTHGPGYASPMEAFTSGVREKVMYVPCIPTTEPSTNYLATVDVDPTSATYSQVTFNRSAVMSNHLTFCHPCFLTVLLFHALMLVIKKGYVRVCMCAGHSQTAYAACQ